MLNQFFFQFFYLLLTLIFHYLFAFFLSSSLNNCLNIFGVSVLVPGERQGSYKGAIKAILSDHIHGTGRTHTDFALEKTLQMMESGQSGSRLHDATVSKVVIVLTDGMSSKKHATKIERDQFNKVCHSMLRSPKPAAV